MNVYSIIFFALSVITAGLHFFFIVKEKEKARCISKPFILFFAGIGLAFLLPDKPLIYIGAFLGCIGDGLLIKQKDKTYFFFGLMTFLLGHISYFATICTLIAAKGIEIPFWSYIVIAVSICGTSFLCYPFIVHYTHERSIPIAIYGAFLATMALTSIQLFTIAKSPIVGVFILIGYLFFSFSDLALLYMLFKKDTKYHNLVVMTTYVAAQYFILAGLALAFLL